jgi:uncharacterized protein (DUF302 family)
MVELTASGDADQVEARLREALDAHGLQLFARIDHAAGARKADVEPEANVLLIFGNPSVGTPLMQADLPLVSPLKTTQGARLQALLKRERRDSNPRPPA